MALRVVVVHGIEATPQSDWLPWFKAELVRLGFDAIIPEMPDTNHPKINEWVSRLAEVVGDAYHDTFLVGHSIGGQAILRYLAQLQGDSKVSGTILVASWTALRKAAFETEEDERTFKPWLQTPIDWDNARRHSDKFTAILSDDDPYVPLEVGDEFAAKLGAKIITERGKGHMSTDTGVTELPSVLDEILLMAGKA
ncbi:MAG: alpha/beta fold hydrolase [Candidatus Micrarchaeota archaeon]|nr:alpha/beta fold hydrolase [Candidatus Micrarchaeota archaeon]